jgi:DNA-binding beta-propeller fold protein YncE
MRKLVPMVCLWFLGSSLVSLVSLTSLTSLASLAQAGEPIIRTIAGTGKPGYSGDDGPALAAQLRDPFAVRIRSDGLLYFSDTNNHCVRTINLKTNTEQIRTVAGSGQAGYAGDGGPATQAKLNEPYGLAIDEQAGHLYIAERINATVRKVDGQTGTISTIAGIAGKKGYSGDGGPGTQAMLREPNGLALDGKGKLYIADVADQRIRVVDLKTGTIATLCGTGKKQTAGDNGPFAQASFAGPRALAIGPGGALYVCEREGNCVRKIDFASGRITRIAGTGQAGYAGDGGKAVEALLKGPKEIEVDEAGNVYIVDTENQVIRKVDALTGIITTVAGNGKLGGSGDDGPATKASLARPHGVAVYNRIIYIGDTLNHRIRAVFP